MGLVARLKPRSMTNQAWGGKPKCAIFYPVHIKLSGLFFCYGQENSKREQLGSVYGWLPCALKSSVSFLKVALGSISFSNSPSHTEIELNYFSLFGFVALLYKEALYFRSSLALFGSIEASTLFAGPRNIPQGQTAAHPQGYSPDSFFFDFRTSGDSATNVAFAV